MTNMKDLLHIQAVKTGDTRAFAAIVSDYQQMVFTIVMKIVENREDAEDITQEIFIKVFKSLGQFKEESEFSTWLYRIAYNTTLSELRKKKLFFTSIDDNLSTINEIDTDEKEEEEIEIKLQYLDIALKKLPPDEIFLVTLYYMDEQSIENISIISNLSASNVKVKLHRIRKKLALELNKIIQDEYK
ncbi:DNA-directed RNA polymerase sigma-70 factor [Bacteroidia bacterium]|nr:DNA-directed RNA polymerase sigma-70 factor [Bacteroidia bacterium]GHT26268.1 DNA-directed RNA polymerase sigma-70 factor [Bacteroidia bacterium]